MQSLDGYRVFKYLMSCCIYTAIMAFIFSAIPLKTTEPTSKVLEHQSSRSKHLTQYEQKTNNEQANDFGKMPNLSAVSPPPRLCEAFPPSRVSFSNAINGDLAVRSSKSSSTTHSTRISSALHQFSSHRELSIILTSIPQLEEREREYMYHTLLVLMKHV